MIALYLASLILGGGLLAISLFAGGDSDHDIDVDADADADFDHDVDVDQDVDVDADQDVDYDAHADVDFDVDVDADADGHADYDADFDKDFHKDFQKGLDKDVDKDLHKDFDKHIEGGFRGVDFFTIFLSLRFWTFFLAFFGAAGALLTLFALLPTVGIAVAAGGTGFVCGTIGAGLVKYFIKDDADSSLKARHLVGQAGRITVRAKPTSPGKVLVEFEDSVREFLALSDDGVLEVGTKVLVINMEEGGVVRVTPQTPALSEDAQRRRKAAATKTGGNVGH